MSRELKKSTYVSRLVDELSEMIVSGKYKDRLPSENDLAKAFNVSKTCIREAKGALIALGAIKVHPGRGTEISNNAKEVLLFKRFIFDDGIPIKLIDVMEGRRVLEPSLSSLAAERAEENDLAIIKADLTNMEKAKNNSQFLRHDLGFHLAVAKASKNQFLSEIYEGMRKLLTKVLLEVLRIETVRKRALMFHKKIYHSIESKDAQKAYEESKKHIEFVINLLNKEKII